MSSNTRNRKLAPKAGNDYKQAELMAAAKEGAVKDVGLPEEMFPKGKCNPWTLCIDTQYAYCTWGSRSCDKRLRLANLPKKIPKKGKVTKLPNPITGPTTSMVKGKLNMPPVTTKRNIQKQMQPPQHRQQPQIQWRPRTRYQLRWKAPTKCCM